MGGMSLVGRLMELIANANVLCLDFGTTMG